MRRVHLTPLLCDRESLPQVAEITGLPIELVEVAHAQWVELWNLPGPRITQFPGGFQVHNLEGRDEMKQVLRALARKEGWYP